MDCSQGSFEGSDFVNVGIFDSLEELSLLNGEQAYVVYWINCLTFGFLHSLKDFAICLLKLILTETIVVIKKAYARAYLPGLYKIFFMYLFDPTPEFLFRFGNLASATQRINIDKIESQVVPAEEAGSER